MLNVRTICEVMNDIGIGKVFGIFYTACHNCHCREDALKCLKIYLRSTMSQLRLSHTLLLYIHKDRTDEINDMAIAKQFLRKMAEVVTCILAICNITILLCDVCISN